MASSMRFLDEKALITDVEFQIHETLQQIRSAVAYGRPESLERLQFHLSFHLKLYCHRFYREPVRNAADFVREQERDRSRSV